MRVTVSWRGGSYLEPKGKEGLAALVGSQLVQGGTAKLEAARLEDRLEALAATLAGSCADTSCSLSLQVLDKDLAEGLDLLLQALTGPAFAQDRLDLAKRQARQRVSRRNDDVLSIAAYQMGYLLFGESHFASAGDTLASLDSITRDDLVAFHARQLHPANLLVAAAGQFERKAMLDALNRTLGALAAGPAAQVSPAVPAPEFARTPGLYVTDKDAPQAMVRWAFPGLRRSDPDWHAAFVTNQILGGPGFTSRLMKKIRSDEGLTYGVYSTLEPGPYWRGDVSGRLQTKNRSVAYALRLALDEMRKLKEQPVSEDELHVIQDGIVEAFPSQWATRQAIAVRFADEAREGWPEDWWAGYREKIQAVTVADVQRMARKLFDSERMVILAVGRAGEMEAGDTDHPGALAAVAPLPLKRLPLRDPATLKPATVERGVLAPGATLQKLAGDFSFTEGPTCDAAGNLFFTDQPNDRILKWSVDGQLSTFLQPAGRANGMHFDRSGRLIACADEKNELWSIAPDGKPTTIWKGYAEKPLNGPNDVWVAPDGGLYFSDPFYARPWWTHKTPPQDGQHVYYLAPGSKALVRVTDDLTQPNGIVGSPDGKTLYVADIGAKKTWRYAIAKDGRLAGKTLVCEEGSDGMTLDEDGNVYLTGDGVKVFDAQGRLIEHVKVPEPWTANVSFCGKDRRTLFITASKGLYSIATRAKGADPAK